VHRRVAAPRPGIGQLCSGPSGKERSRRKNTKRGDYFSITSVGQIVRDCSNGSGGRQWRRRVLTGRKPLEEEKENFDTSKLTSEKEGQKKGKVASKKKRARVQKAEVGTANWKATERVKERSRRQWITSEGSKMSKKQRTEIISFNEDTRKGKTSKRQSGPRMNFGQFHIGHRERGQGGKRQFSVRLADVSIRTFWGLAKRGLKISPAFKHRQHRDLVEPFRELPAQPVREKRRAPKTRGIRALSISF